MNGFPSQSIVDKCRHWITGMGSPGWAAGVTAREIVAELGEEVADKVLDILSADPDGTTYGEAVERVDPELAEKLAR